MKTEHLYKLYFALLLNLFITSLIFTSDYYSSLGFMIISLFSIGISVVTLLIGEILKNEN